MCDPGTQD